jgi:hypothetical protein
MTAIGTKLPIPNVRFPVASGDKADLSQRLLNNRDFMSARSKVLACLAEVPYSASKRAFM